MGLLVGVVTGSLAGRPTQIEAEPEAIADQLRALVPRSSSAIVAIAPAPEVDELLAAASDDAQSVVRRTLSAEEEAAFEAALTAAPPTSPDRQGPR